MTITISQSVADALKAAHEEKNKESKIVTEETRRAWIYGHPPSKIFMIGMDPDTGIIDTIIPFKNSDLIPGTGCHSITHIQPDSLAKTYVKISQLGKIPCGYARANTPTAYNYDNRKLYWYPQSVILSKRKDIVISCQGDIFAHVLPDIRNTHTVKIQEQSDDLL